MASPQCENGYAKLANELLEALSHTQLSGYQTRCLFFLIRKTYGWEKKSDTISLSQWCQGTGLSKAHVCHALGQLKERNIVAKIGNEFSFVKDYTRWRALPKSATLPKSAIKIAEIGNRTIRNTIETITTEIPPNPEARKLAEYLMQKIKAIKPDAKPPKLDTWAKSFDRLLRLDKRKPERIRQVIDFATTDEFWHKNILSAGKLREKFDQLELVMKSKQFNKLPPKQTKWCPQCKTVAVKPGSELCPNCLLH